MAIFSYPPGGRTHDLVIRYETHGAEIGTVSKTYQPVDFYQADLRVVR
jgi:hypothetical protein